MLNGKNSFPTNILISEIGVNVKKFYKDLPEGDPKNSNGTCEKMVNFSGMDLNKLTPLKVGLTKTIDFIKEETL